MPCQVSFRTSFRYRLPSQTLQPRRTSSRNDSSTSRKPRPVHSGQEPWALKLKSAGDTRLAAANARRMGSNTPT